MVPVSDARLLRVGDRAGVELASGKQIEDVKITEITYMQDRDYRVGMPQTMTAETMALITMTTEKRLDESMIGVPALVTYRVGVSSYMRYLLGSP